MLPVAPPLERNEAAWAWWAAMGSPRYVMAPMVRCAVICVCSD